MPLEEVAKEEAIEETVAEAEIESTEETNLEIAPEVHTENISTDPEFVEATQNSEDAKSSSFMTNFVLFMSFVGVAYLVNKKQEEAEQYNYKNTAEQKSMFGGGNKDESMFKSWNKDPNIGNRQRSASLIDMGEDDEIYIQ